MINNSFRKTLVQYLHPFSWLSLQYSYGSYDYRDEDSRPSSRNNSPHKQRIMRPSQNKSFVPYRVFANHCQQLQEEQINEIIKNLDLIPQASPSDVSAFVRANKIQGKLQNIATSFDFLPQKIRDALLQKNITSPSAIQQAIMPLIFEGHDLIAIAETGSGKTLAFALPGIMHIGAQPKTQGPRILVLAPTRELAQQIQTQYSLFTQTCCLYGGVPKPSQYGDLVGQKDRYKKSESPNVIIATPGRLLDLMKDGLPLRSITQVVLDEADRMLDMGFEDQIRDVLQGVREDRQTLFFSATWPADVQRLADSLCQQDPIFLQLGERGLSVNKNIEQSLIIANIDKFEQFMEYVDQIRDQKMLIFCQRKMDTQKLEYRLSQHGIRARYLHGDLGQNERDYIMNHFRDGSINCLITTNLASRGLDVQDIDVVINYDFPENIEDYIHRIGRTGRAGKKGMAMSFIEPRFMTQRLKKELIEVFKQSSQRVPSEFMNLRLY